MNRSVMMPNPEWLRWTARALVPILAALGASTAGFAETVELKLSEGQNEIVRTISLVDRDSPAEILFIVSSETGGTSEFDARVVSPDVASMLVNGGGVPETVVSVNDSLSEFHYRQLVSGVTGITLRLDARFDYPTFDQAELVVSLRRVTDFCSMWATVEGDVNRTAFGDVAYYNVFEEGVREGMASGTAMDPGAHEALQGLLRMAQYWQTELDLPVEDAADEEESSKKDSKDWDTSGTDTFGLSLAEVDMDGDSEANAGIAGAISVLGESFSLGASGVSDKVDLDGEFGFYEVKISSIMVAPGALDANVSGVKFLWKPGLPGSASLHIKDEGGGVISGYVEAELYTEKPYNNGRKLKIDVSAKFVALEGAYSCN